MKHNYYLDESGNSGDLINCKTGLKFGDQPIFSLACVGIDDLDEINSFVNNLNVKHGLEHGELRSSNIYYKKPEAILDLAVFISKKSLPLFVELVDKKYSIAASIVHNHIMPPYFMQDEVNGIAQYIRNGLADYIANNLADSNYESFFKACIYPTENNLLASMNDLKAFFESKSDDFNAAELVIQAIDESIDDYNILKSKLGMEEAVKKFLPMPDMTKNGTPVKLLPHVHSMFNIIGRLNKYHSRRLSDVALFHDNQDNFDNILIRCNECLKDVKLSYDPPAASHVDFDIVENLSLSFVDSKLNVGVQIADLLAGFFNRYVNGLLYKNNVEIKDIYHNIFKEFGSSFRTTSSMGVNFVIPKSKGQFIFQKFGL